MEINGVTIIEINPECKQAAFEHAARLHAEMMMQRLQSNAEFRKNVIEKWKEEHKT